MAGNFKIDIDADGIALVTWDMPGKSMNVIDVGVITELTAVVEKVATDPGIKGAVITSGSPRGAAPRCPTAQSCAPSTGRSPTPTGPARPGRAPR